MSDKFKNIASNILGLILVIVSVYAIIEAKITLVTFGVLMLVSLALFLFKTSTSVEFIKKFLEQKLK